MFLCTLVGPLFPPPDRPASSTCPSRVSFTGFFRYFYFGVPVVALSAAPARPACAPCSSLCYPRLAFPHPLTLLCPLRFPVSQPTLPVRLPSLSEPRCHWCLTPACSTPAPLCRPYPFPWCLSHPSVPSVPVSHLILDALCPVWGGGVYLGTGLWPCLRTGMTLAVGFLRTMSNRIFRRNTDRTTVRRLSNSPRCICTVESSRIDQLRQFGTELFQSDKSPQQDPVWSPRVHTLLHLGGVPWRRRPPRPGAFRVGRGQPLRAGHV